MLRGKEVERHRGTEALGANSLEVMLLSERGLRITKNERSEALVGLRELQRLPGRGVGPLNKGVADTPVRRKWWNLCSGPSCLA